MNKGLAKIGKEVGFIRTGAGNPRNGEGSFIRLNNNSIMFAYINYTDGGWYDHCPADIAARR